MGDHLEALLQRAIMLAIDALLVAICDVQQDIGIVIVLTAFIQLQFNAKEATARSIENRQGLEVVAMDFLAGLAGIAEAVGTVGILVILIKVIGGVIVDDLAAVGASGIVPLVAAQADGSELVLSIDNR